jgi:NADPH:quinone reductase-like Zn-dependent oxidoreductase/acyl carrier protein
MVGVAHAMLSLYHSAVLGISHLQNVNPYVASALGGRRNWCLPRETASFPVNGTCGVSSFAFQGTNAHAAFQRSGTAEGAGSLPLRPAPIIWAREIHWLAPLPHPLLQSGHEDDSTISFECRINSSPGLAVVWDHCVNGTVLFPGAGYFELAAAALCLAGSQKWDIGAVANVTIPTPCKLPALPSTELPVLRCSVSLDNGTIEVLSEAPSQGSKLVHMQGRVVELLHGSQASGPPPMNASLLVLGNCLPTSLAWLEGGQLGTVARPVSADEELEQFNMAALDSCLHLAAAASSPTANLMKVPAALGALLAGQLLTHEGDLWGINCPRSGPEGTGQSPGVLDCWLSRGVRLEGLVVKPLAPKASKESIAALQPDEVLYETFWHTVAPLGTEARRSETSSYLFGGDGIQASSSLLSVLHATAAHKSSDALGLLVQSTDAAGNSAYPTRASAASADTAALQGMVRCAAIELLGREICSLDADSNRVGSSEAGVSFYSGECPGTHPPSALSLRGGAREEAVLGRSRLRPTLDRFQLLPQPRGALGNLKPSHASRSALGPEEALLVVRAVGINFRDVLNVLGMYPGDPGPPGGDCAGVIEAVGSSVKHLGPGDPVFGLAGGSLGSHVRTPAETLVALPPCLSFEGAASMSTVFITVDMAFERAAALRQGECVLVHAAAGGVGLAALQTAAARACRVIATAGSPFKRAFVRGQCVPDALGSRTTEFVSEVAQLGGVDLVLNSLTSPGFVSASLASLRPGGRLVEISKRDIWSHARILQERPDVSYTLVAVDFLPPASVQAALCRLSGRVAAGELRPLPSGLHTLANVTAALRQMSLARHIGKITVQVQVLGPSMAMRGTVGNVLITGGLGSLGSITATWIAGAVPATVVVTGRSGRCRKESSLVQLVRGAHLNVVCFVAADASCSEDACMLALTGGGRLVGVVHAAGVLADATLGNQSLRGLKAVFAPKSEAYGKVHSHGTWLAPSSWVLLFSSVASLMGSPGQSNYAAANAWLDAAALGSQRRGECTMSIQWGAWSGAGMASGDAGTQARVERSGLGLIGTATGLCALQSFMLAVCSPAVSAAVPVNWERFLANQGASNSYLFSEFVDASPSATMEERPIMGDSKVGSGSLNYGIEDIAEMVYSAVKSVLGLSVGQDDALMAAGLDSLSAVELRNSLETLVGVSLPGTLVFDYPTVNGLASYLSSVVNTRDKEAQSNFVAPVKSVPSMNLTSQESFGDLIVISGIAGQTWLLQQYRGGEVARRIPAARWDPDVGFDGEGLGPQVSNCWHFKEILENESNEWQRY